MHRFTILLAAVCSCWALPGRAQQDPMFTKYLFNSLAYNPAYAGSNEALVVSAIHRQQWTGLDGAPSTQSLTAHSPLRNERVGVGFSLVRDKIGAGGTLDFGVAYAYRLPLGEVFKLAGGLQANITQWRGNWSELTLDNTADPVFQENINRWLPNFGAGVYLYSTHFYAGFGSPRLVEHNLREANGEGETLFARTYRHYYTTVGGAFPWNGNEDFVVRPTLLLKSAGLFSSLRKEASGQRLGSPTEVDVDLSVLLRQTLWLGAAYRMALERSVSSDDSFDLWADLVLRNGLRLGASYDILLSPIRKVSGGSFELMLGYEFNIKKSRVASTRYFYF
jgi:type IX secretion system PorP/SprF family membrane protein